MFERAYRFPNLLSEFVYTRTYARWLEDEKRRETWPETVGRYVDWVFDGKNVPSYLPEKARAAILNFDVLPSMRALWCAGEAMERDNTCGYNCSFLPIDNLKAFSEALYVLMQGTGVGYSVESTFINNLPQVAYPTGDSVDYVIGDSTEGWADAVYFGVTAFHRGQDVKFHYDRIRPKGSRLKIKGGRASGPEPLKRVLDFARETISKAAGRRLKPIEAHDIMCMIAEIVMVGGFRRASLISFSDPEDTEMRHAKDWSKGKFPSIRYMANISAYYSEKPTQEVFWREWEALVQSGSGERGFSMGNWHQRADRPAGEVRSNPCHEIGLRFKRALDPWTGEGGGGQFCVSGDTPLITREGITTIRDSVGHPVHIWNGTQWSKVTPTQTGIGQKLYRVNFSDGSYLDTTAYHRFSVSNRGTRVRKTPWREMSLSEIVGAGVSKRWATEPFRIEQDSGIQIEPKHAYTAGAAVGDGWIRKTSGGGHSNPRVYVGLFGKKDSIMPVVGVRGKERTANAGNLAIKMTAVFCPDQDPAFIQDVKDNALALDALFQWSRESILQFIAGWLDADGSQLTGGGVRLYVSGEDRARKLQLLLTKCGLRSTVSLLQAAGTETNYGPRTKDMWYLGITDCGAIPCHRLNTSLGHPPQAKSKFQTIRSIEELPGLHATFCFEEPIRHMAVFGNTLTYQCNLAATVMRSHDTLETMAEKVKIATWIGAVQSSYTHFPYLRPAWTELCQEDRLLGIDITGQCDNPALSGDEDAMTFLNATARATAIIAADALGINRPAAVTCGKPSGNTSQLVDCASGFHSRYAKFYHRHVRISAKDPLFRLIRDTGVPVFKENGQEHLPDHEVDVWVARFPVKAPETAMTRHDEKTLDQLERYLQVMRSWCGEKGHNQSATIYVREGEWTEVGEWLWEHFDEVTGLSFLPFNGGNYKLAPYEELTEEEYLRSVAEMPELNFKALSRYEQMDEGNGAQEPACASGQCEL